MSHLEEGIVTARCELAGELDVAVQPAPSGDKTHKQLKKRCFGDPQHPPLAQIPPPGPLQRGHIAHPWDTHAQKSSTVLNLVTRRRFACHILLLSFLKNHSAHLGREGRWGVSHAEAPLQPQHPPPSAWERLPMATPPIPILQGVLAQGLCQEQFLLLSPPPPLPLLLPPLGKEGQPQGSPWPP